jgi:biotin operon repressor
VYDTKVLKDDKYKDLSHSAVLLYSLLITEKKFARADEQVDDIGTYMHFPQSKMSEVLNVSPRTVRKYIRELKDVGLVKTSSGGKGKPVKIYVRDPEMEVVIDE